MFIKHDKAPPKSLRRNVDKKFQKMAQLFQPEIKKIA